jgi:hypothetical protein
MRMLALRVAIIVGASMALATEAIGQTQSTPPAGQRSPSPGSQSPMPGQEKIIQGQVKSVHPSGTELTLMDGTRLVAPPGSVIRPGLLTEGAIVIATYREEGGEKVMTELAVGKEPSASPPSEPRSPREPSTAPPSDPPKRY